MSPQLVHCPKCRAMQPRQARCGVCGARLPGDSDSDTVSGREAARLALLMVGLFGGFVLVSALLLWLAFSLTQ